MIREHRRLGCCTRFTQRAGDLLHAHSRPAATPRRTVPRCRHPAFTLGMRKTGEWNGRMFAAVVPAQPRNHWLQSLARTELIPQSRPHQKEPAPWVSRSRRCGPSRPTSSANDSRAISVTRLSSCSSRCSAATSPAPAAARSSIRRTSSSRTSPPRTASAPPRNAALRWFRSPAASRCCTPRSRPSSTSWSSGRSTSTSAPTPVCSRRSSSRACSRPASTSPSPCTWTGRRSTTTSPSAARAPSRKPTAGIKLACERGFRVTTNTTLFDGFDPNSVRAFFDEMMDLGVEGMMVSPGYAYPKAPDQKSFLRERKKTTEAFDTLLANRKKRGSSTSRLCSSSSSWAGASTSARRGATPRTTSSAGRSPAISCRTATSTPSRN